MSIQKQKKQKFLFEALIYQLQHLPWSKGLFSFFDKIKAGTLIISFFKKNKTEMKMNKMFITIPLILMVILFTSNAMAHDDAHSEEKDGHGMYE
jgi:hypothetical protein